MSWFIRSRITRWTAVAIVFASLAAGAAAAVPDWPAAQGRRPAHAAPVRESLLSTVWEWLGSLFVRPADPPPAGAPAKAGCGMDPDGKPLPCK